MIQITIVIWTKSRRISGWVLELPSWRAVKFLRDWALQNPVTWTGIINAKTSLQTGDRSLCRKYIFNSVPEVRNKLVFKSVNKKRPSSISKLNLCFLKFFER